MADTLREEKGSARRREVVAAQRGFSSTGLGAGTPAAALELEGPGRNRAYLDRLARELASWSERLARACERPLGRSREARIEHRKGILVSKVRLRNIERRLAEMRGSQARFASLRPGLLLLWSLLTAGIEQSEAGGAAAP